MSTLPISKQAATPTLTNASVPAPGSGVVTGGPSPQVTQPGQVAQAPRPQLRPVPLVARPLSGPEYTNVKWKNPHVTGRYILREDPNKAGSTLRYSQAVAMGFRPATPLDAEVPGLSPTNGHFINGDLILMCMDRERYDGALLYKDQQARIKADPRNLVNYTRNQIAIRSGPGHNVVAYEPGGEEARQPGQQSMDLGPRSPHITPSSTED